MSNRDAMESLKRELKQAEPNKISSIRLVSSTLQYMIHIVTYCYVLIRVLLHIECMI